MFIWLSLRFSLRRRRSGAPDPLRSSSRPSHPGLLLLVLRLSLFSSVPGLLIPFKRPFSSLPIHHLPRARPPFWDLAVLSSPLPLPPLLASSSLCLLLVSLPGFFLASADNDLLCVELPLLFSLSILCPARIEDLVCTEDVSLSLSPLLSLSLCPSLFLPLSIPLLDVCQCLTW